jgi:hypothetical protein
LDQTLLNPLDASKGTVVLQKIIANNPKIKEKTPRLAAFNAAVDELAERGI